MNSKRIYLPAIASLMIVCMVVPFATAQVSTVTVARALPTLQVVTIPEDDQVLSTGVIVLGLQPNMATWGPTGKPVDNYCLNTLGVLPGTSACVKLEAQYKIMITFNGQPVGSTTSTTGVPAAGFGYSCTFIKKEKMQPLQHPQFTQEIIRTFLTDESANFVCKLREYPAQVPGVGVLDVYYVGTAAPQYIADYIMFVQVWTTYGRTVVYGSDIQDLCVLGWANNDNTMYITKPDGTLAFSWPDPFGAASAAGIRGESYVSCEELAVLQRQNLGLQPFGE